MTRTFAIFLQKSERKFRPLTRSRSSLPLREEQSEVGPERPGLPSIGAIRHLGQFRNSCKLFENIEGGVFLRKTPLCRVPSVYTNSETAIAVRDQRTVASIVRWTEVILCNTNSGSDALTSLGETAAAGFWLQRPFGSDPSRTLLKAHPAAWSRATRKHVAHKTGLCWVGLNGTVVSIPQAEQVRRVSIRCLPPGLSRLVLHCLHCLGSLTKPRSRKNCCSPAEKTNITPHDKHLRSLSANSIDSPNLDGEAILVKAPVFNDAQRWCSRHGTLILRAGVLPAAIV
jgi:hypothetical protein